MECGRGHGIQLRMQETYEGMDEKWGGYTHAAWGWLSGGPVALLSGHTQRGLQATRRGGRCGVKVLYSSMEDEWKKDNDRWDKGKIS